MMELFTNFRFLLFGMITLLTVVLIIAITCLAAYRAELAFKTQMVNRGMSVKDIERLIADSPHTKHPDRSPGASCLDEYALNEILSVLGRAGAPAAVIEEVLWAFRSVDEPIQSIISEAVQHLVGSADEVNGEQIIAVVRPLSRGPSRHP
jgi:hypothetical protein